MSVWLMLGVGAVAVLTVSVVVGLLVAGALGHVSRELSELVEAGPWDPEAHDSTRRQP